MVSSEKKKTIGKYIIVILCMAILFFLLLPFLEEGAGTATPTAPKKASPQIFTSNPLNDLVRKVYSLFARNNRKQGPRDFLAAAEHTPAFSAGPTNVSETLPNPSGETQLPEEKSETVAAATDAYGEAAFVDENGEWVLIQQTAPDSSQRGLHEVNARDSAYDKLLRLERQAKYTGGATQTQPVQSIPESKWARMWKPIQQMLGLDRQKSTAVASARQTAAGNAGLGASRNTAGNSYASFDDSWSWTPGPANNNAVGSPVFNLLNPAQFLRETADNLKDTARNILDSQSAKDTAAAVDQKRDQYLAQFNQTLAAQLAQDATGETQNLVADTVACGGEKSSSLYSSAPQGCSDTGVNQETAQQARAQSIGNLARALGIPNADENLAMDMIVLLGKTTPQDSLVRPETQDPELQKLYDFFYDYSGCKEHDCYWVGANADFQKDPSLQTVISAAGGNYIGEGNPQTHNAASIISRYTSWVIVNEPDYDGRFDDTNPQAQQATQKLLEAIPQYMPLTKDQLSQILARNNPPAKGQTPSQRPVLVVTADANNTKVLADEGTLTDLSYVVWDPKGQILDATASNTAEDGFEEAVYTDPAQRGQALNQLIVNRVTQVKTQLNKASQDMTDEVATRTAKDSAAKVAEEFKQKLGNKPSDFL